jgi:hypothetical protein
MARFLPIIKKKELTPKEKEKIDCLRLSWSNNVGKITPSNENEQFLIYPRAIATECGISQKGSKSHWTDKIKKR